MVSLLPSLVELIQKIAKRAVEEAQPTSIEYGTVVSANPLKISLEQKLTLDSTHLILTNNVKDFEVEMTVDGVRKKYTVHNQLKNGDKVILFRQQGGQKFVVLDKVVTS